MSGSDNEKGSTALGEESLGLVPTAELLPEREALGTLLFEMTPQGVVCHDANGVIAANLAAQQMLGLSSAHLQGHPTVASDWRFVHEDGSDFPWDEQPGMVALRTAREVRDVVVGVVNPEGSTYRWVNVTAKPLLRPGESMPSRSLVFLDDITERKTLEDAVQSERKFIASVLDTVPVGVVTLDAAGLVTSANQRAVSILGLRQDDPLRMTFDAPVWRILAVDGSPFPEDRLPFSVVMATGRPVFGVKHAIHWPEGKRVVLSINAAPTFDEQGHVAGMTASIEDTTEPERAENELARSHDLLTNLARLVPGVIYQYRLYPDGRSAFPYSSPGMNDIYEVTPEAVQKDATPVFGRLHPEDYDRVGATIMESARTLQTFYCEFRVILPRQGLRWRSSQAHPERTEDGGTLWHGIISDITERKLAEAEKSILEDQLHQAQKMEAVGRLAGGVAHDFNNMLSAILGHVEMAMEDVDSTQALYADLQEIQTAARRSAELTRQLLAFARKQTVAPRVLELNQTVEGMLKMLHRLIGEDIDLTFQPHADLWSVKLDPSQIDQILANLCVNARDAIADVGKITIETENSRFDQDYCANHVGHVVGDYVQLAVSDNGCGMDKATLARLFEPFFTTKESGKGTGLGLATVYGIVKQNSGFINVYSEPGHGTTFKIYLPRHVSDAGVAVERAARPAARGNETILVVEDEPSLLNMTKRILERLGYIVVTASAPGEAICLAREYPCEIHLLVTDVVMPEMNGKDLAKQLQSLFPGLKCLFMSGYTASVIAHHGVLDDGVNFVQKPFSKEDLAAKVREVLDGGNVAGAVIVSPDTTLLGV